MSNASAVLAVPYDQSSQTQKQRWTNEPPPPVRWRSWPLVERPLVSLALGAALAALGVGVWHAAGQVRLALAALAAVLVSLWRFFLPTTFELDADGVHEWRFGRHRHTPWSWIRRYQVCSAGVLLLPHDTPCPLDALRGLYLPWAEHREAVVAHVHYYLDRPVEL